MSVRVRMAPSPTGFLHVGGVRTFLFNWLFARGAGGECRLRIENTDTGREVAEAVDQIQRSLLWLGIDWDGPVTFQLDRQDEVRELRRAAARRRAAPTSTRARSASACPTRASSPGRTPCAAGSSSRTPTSPTSCSSAPTGARPTTSPRRSRTCSTGSRHVIRGNDHVSNTPTQINILQALGAELPVYAHVPDVLGDDGKKLSKRHGAVSIDAFRAEGYLPAALMNFLALLGWSYDDKTTVMQPDELDRALHARAGRSEPRDLRLREARLAERRLPARARARTTTPRRCSAGSPSRGSTGRPSACARSAPLVQEKIERFSQYPDFARFLFEPVDPDGADPEICAAAAAALAAVEPWRAERDRGGAARARRASSARSRGRRSSRSGSRSPARPSRPGCSRASSCSAREESLARLAAAYGR